jgi:hypothetical protein
MANSLWNSKLSCTVNGIEYDFATRMGTLHMAEFNCCDMNGAIELFKRIDSSVKTILTFAGSERDTMYEKRNGDWQALVPAS